MKDGRDIKASASAPDAPNAAAPQASKATTTEAVPRRALFGTGLLGAFGLLAQACSSEMGGFSSGAIGRKRSDKPSGGETDLSDGGGDDIPDACRDLEGEEQAACIEQAAGGDDLGGGDGATTVDPNDTTSCHANVTTQIDLKNIPTATGDLVPRVVFYGRKDSTLLAMKWTSDKDLGHIIITTPSGKLLALHGITGADRDGNGKYRPIVVDNLWLTSGGQELSDIRIVVQTAAGSFVHSEPIVYLKSRKNDQGTKLDVVDLLSDGGPVEANMGRWSVTRFAEGSGFNKDNSYGYPLTVPTATNPKPPTRGLNTVTPKSTWSPVSNRGIQGKVTDIMGDEIGSLAGGALLEHQLFCTYVEAGGVYYRTILHIG